MRHVDIGSGREGFTIASIAEAPDRAGIAELKPFAAKHRRVQRAGDGHDVEVKRWREPAVQAELLMAIEPPRRQRGEIEEVQIDGLLDLVRKGPVEQYELDVCLDDCQARRRYQALLVGQGHGSPQDFQLCSVRM